MLVRTFVAVEPQIMGYTLQTLAQAPPLSPSETQGLTAAVIGELREAAP
jgi:hypothetical protein